jgi:flagellar biosynthesis protein FlhF
MEARTYQAREIREALALVRRELGPEAVILETRRVPGRALGLLGGTLIEVTAAAPDGAAPTPTEKAPADLRPIRALLPERRAERVREQPKQPAKAMIAEDPGVAIAAAIGQSQSVAPHAALRRRLLAAMVPRDLAEGWLRALPQGLDAQQADTALRKNLRNALGPAIGLGFPGARVVAFVGPTGVGKTTTVAKLAASASLVSGQKVALVSLDDGRIGGTAALRAYAKLLELPITVAPPQGFATALADHRNAELVLVDTAGLSPANPEGFAELGRKLARAGEPVRTQLCIAAATRAEELERIAHLYRPADPQALLVTKVDEAIAIGSVMALRMRSQLPFSFAATGPQVPDDLTLAHPDFLLDLLLGGARP